MFDRVVLAAERHDGPEPVSLGARTVAWYRKQAPAYAAR
jgi:predicted DNA-binding transcriptional regulator AlpA